MRRSRAPGSTRRNRLHIKGALHIHSTLSRDGTLSIAELVRWYGSKGYQFLAMSEHSEDLDDSKAQMLQQASAENSSKEFCVIPGIEFSCDDGIHIPALGVVNLVPTKNPVEVIEEIHRRDGFAVLAHPRRIKWKCPEEVLRAIDAVEIWNIGYDGKYLPSAQALRAFQKMSQINPKLLAVASQDFHQTGGFYDVALEMDVGLLNPAGILTALRKGRYQIASRFFRTDPQARLSWKRNASLHLISWQLHYLRRARQFFLRWSS